MKIYSFFFFIKSIIYLSSFNYSLSQTNQNQNQNNTFIDNLRSDSGNNQVHFENNEIYYNSSDLNKSISFNNSNNDVTDLKNLKLIAIIFIINHGAEKEANIEEYKLIRNPSLNRDISQTGKTQQKYLGFYIKSKYKQFFINLKPKNVKIYSNPKLKCIMSGIVILNTIFPNFSYYFEEDSKPHLPKSYYNQEEILKGILDLKINYERRGINSYYKRCKEKLFINYSNSLNENSKSLLSKTFNEYLKVIKDDNFNLSTILEIYDLILINKVFKPIDLNLETEKTFKRIVLTETYLKGYSKDDHPKAKYIRKIDKMLSSEFFFKTYKFIKNIDECESKLIMEGKLNNFSDNIECEKIMFNFYERSDLIEILSMILNKKKIHDNLENIILKTEDSVNLFDMLYPQFSAYINIEIYRLNSIFYLKFLLNDENIILVLKEYLYIKSDEVYEGMIKYSDYKSLIFNRLQKNDRKDVIDLDNECKKFRK